MISDKIQRGKLSSGDLLLSYGVPRQKVHTTLLDEKVYRRIQAKDVMTMMMMTRSFHEEY